MADYHNLDESNKPISISYAGKTFSGETKFNGSTFTGDGGNLKGAVFEGSADFTDAIFEGETVDFTDAVFLAGVLFENAQFGKDYQRTFGDLEIRFSANDDFYCLETKRNIGGDKKKDTIFFNDPKELNLLKLLKNDNDHIRIIQAFDIFRRSPKNVSFTGCRFGAINIEGFSTEHINNVINKEGYRINRFNLHRKYRTALEVFRNHNFSSESSLSEVEKTGLMSILARHLETTELDNRCLDSSVSFKQAKFYPQADVSFENSLFLNHEAVDFTSSTFSNGKDVNFSSATFSNSGNVDFDLVAFSNGRNVNFTSSTFNNRGEVSFHSSTFSNIGAINLSQIIWINGGKLDLSFKEFRETISIKFDECLFLSAGDISFKEARFPEKGSLMFQRCYFGRSPTVDFTGAFFRHASFEGGEIKWLKEDSPEQTPKDRLKEKYDSLPDKTKNQLESGETLVFEKSGIDEDGENVTQVLWKDLTTESAKNLTLRRVNLSHSLFDGMTLSHIQLNAPEWLEDKDGRKILYEEIKLRETTLKENRAISKFDLKNIEDQYTQLKNNLEKQGNYLNAGYFHYGEQEIRREILGMGLKWNSGPQNTMSRFLGSCYKFCSGYGEMLGRAFIAGLCMLLVFSILLALMSLSTFPDTAFKELGVMGFLEKFLLKVFSALVEIITPFSWKGSKPFLETINESKFGSGRMFFLILFQFIVLAIQSPLLVLAVRRRFKR